MTISVMLVDDSVNCRGDVRVLLEATPDLRIVGEASGGMEALAQANRLRPDVVLVNCVAPYMQGMLVTGWLCKHQPAMRVVILSMYEDDAYVLSAIQNGACGYILKEEIVSHLAQAVAAAAAGKFYISPSLLEKFDQSKIDQLVHLGEMNIHPSRDRHLPDRW